MNTQSTAAKSRSPWTLWSWQNMLALAIVLIGVGGIVFMTQWVANETTKPIPKPASVKSLLAFEQPVIEEETIDEMYPNVGHHDFWFANPSDGPVQVSLLRTSCKCQNVAVLVLAPEAAQKLRAPGRAAAAWLAGAVPWPAALAGVALAQEPVRELEQPESWQKIEEGKGTVDVPAGHSGKVRMVWSGRGEGANRLKILIGTQKPEDPNSNAPVPLELPVRLFKPVLVTSRELDVGMFGLNSEKQQSFVCFSATRNQFDVEVKSKIPNPCFSVQVQPFTEEQRQAQQKQAGTIPVRCGYHIAVTVKERVPGGQLDLGPFHHRLEIHSSELVEPIDVEVFGSVLGDIRLTGSEQQRISLGDFDARAGVSRTEILESETPGLKLELDKKFPDYLKVDLKEADEPNRWKVTVTVPPNRAFGILPRESSLLFKIGGTPERRIRIPVSGHATN